MRNPLSDDCLKLGLAAPPEFAFTRRMFIAAAATALCTTSVSAATATSIASGQVPRVDPDFWKRPRELWLKRLETGEETKVFYWANGNYLVEGYTRLCQLMRDVRENKAVQMDTTLLNVLAGLQAYYAAFGLTGPIILTSGFRTFATNRRLAGEGAALNSMHLYARAADITIPGITVKHLGAVKNYLHAGGLGFYPSKHFIHIDTGRARTWSG